MLTRSTVSELLLTSVRNCYDLAFFLYKHTLYLVLLTYNNNQIPVVVVVSTVSKNRLICILCVLQHTPKRLTSRKKCISGLQETSAHTVNRQDGGIGRRFDENRSTSLFTI